MNSSSATPSPLLTASLLPAIGITMISAAMFTGSHGIVRHVGGSIHPFEVAFFSNLFSFFFYINKSRATVGLLQNFRYILFAVS